MPPVAPITLDSPSETYRAHIAPDTGRIALAGPDLSGAPLAAVLTLEPIEVTFSSGTVVLGRVVGSPRIAGGELEVDQDLGGAAATARMTFPADDGDGVREVHVNTLEGMWTGMRNFLRPFRGVNKKTRTSTSV